MNGSDWRSAVLSSVDALADELAELAAALIAVPSVGGSDDEPRAQHLLADWLDAHGLTAARREAAVPSRAPGFPGMEVERDRLVDVVARTSGTGTGPDLLLLGHTDVVPADDAEQFRPRWEGDRLIGRGASDMKSGVAAMCVAAAGLAASGVTLRGDVVVAPVSAEEDGGAGTFALLADPDVLGLAPGSAAIVPEPTGGSIVAGNAGCLTFRLRIPGRSAHGALRWQGANPMDGLPSVLAALRRLEEQRCRGAGDLFAPWPLAYPISVGTVAGGTWASTVPSEVVLTGRYGVRLGETLPQARQAFESAVATAAASDPYLVEHPPQIEWWGAEFASALTGEDEPVIAALRRAGVPGDVSAAPYGSDLRLLVGAGIPAVQFGPGSPAAAHTAQEWVLGSDMLACARALALTAGEFCGVAAGAVDNG